MRLNKNFIASIFNWLRETLEAAESPFVLFALIILPIFAPLVPAVVTGIRLRDQLHFDPWIAYTTAGVLELLGYVGAIAFIKSIYRWRRQGGFFAVLMTGAAYGFYVYAMYAINVRLGSLAGDSDVVSQVFAILSFLTVPTGLLAAEHVNERDEADEKERVRQEVRQDKMERYKIKHGANTERTPNKNTEHRTNKSSEANNKANEIRSFVLQVQNTEQRVPRVSEIARELGVAKSYASETLHTILREQGLE